MKRVLIAGETPKTRNYENAMRKLGITSVTSLHVPDSSYYDGLILPGGGDIDPHLFGQMNQETRHFNPILDRLQLAVLRAFVNDRKPILGICKGMQLINIFFGGDMHQHLQSACAHESLDRDQLHPTDISKGSCMEHLYGTSCIVNSAHHQGVDNPGRGIAYTQFAQDGVVEALEHQFLPIIGVQWHPERIKCGEILLQWFVG